MLTLTWHAHAAFSLEAEGAPRVLVDPYRPGGLGGRFRLPPIDVPADLVLVTHWHEDHSWLGPAHRGAAVADTSGRWAGVPVVAVEAYHDAERGARMGLTRMLLVELGGLRVAHLGDVGAPPDDAQWAALGPIDIALVPAGGTYTLGPAEAAIVARRSGATWVVPMHCAHAGVDLPLEPVDRFVDAWRGPVERPTSRRLVFDPSARPGHPVALVLPPCAPAPPFATTTVSEVRT